MTLKPVPVLILYILWYSSLDLDSRNQMTQLRPPEVRGLFGWVGLWQLMTDISLDMEMQLQTSLFLPSALHTTGCRSDTYWACDWLISWRLHNAWLILHQFWASVGYTTSDNHHVLNWSRCRNKWEKVFLIDLFNTDVWSTPEPSIPHGLQSPRTSDVTDWVTIAATLCWCFWLNKMLCSGTVFAVIRSCNAIHDWTKSRQRCPRSCQFRS